MAERAIAAIKALALIVAFVLISLADAPSFAAERPTWSPRTATERSWGGLSKEELVAVNAAARKIPSVRIEISCGGTFCRTLAEDLDEALESAGHDVYLESPMFDLGKGAGIYPDNEDSRALAKAISDATGGRIKFGVFPSDQPHAQRKIVIGIGRKPR